MEGCKQCECVSSVNSCHPCFYGIPPAKSCSTTNIYISTSKFLFGPQSNGEASQAVAPVRKVDWLEVEDTLGRLQTAGQSELASATDPLVRLQMKQSGAAQQLTKEQVCGIVKLSCVPHWAMTVHDGTHKIRVQQTGNRPQLIRVKFRFDVQQQNSGNAIPVHPTRVRVCA